MNNRSGTRHQNDKMVNIEILAVDLYFCLAFSLKNKSMDVNEQLEDFFECFSLDTLVKLLLIFR